MKMPREIPVMTLPNATLFPQGLMRLYIFEPRYRQMLSDALHSNRMFAVAMQKPGTMRETPAPVAGLGLIRVAVGHRDGTSHLVLQGVARVELHEVVRYKPYRVQRIRPLPTPPCDNVTVDALVVKMRELLEERMELELPFSSGALPATIPPKDILKHLDSLTDPEQAADWVSCAVLPGAAERQTILETVDVESRLRRLIHFLLAEARNKRKRDGA
jgi:Lon protease-like protein